MRPTIPTVGRVAVQVMTPDTPRYCEGSARSRQSD
jgi:hypothetical protein